jgi:competence protein ComEC
MKKEDTIKIFALAMLVFLNIFIWMRPVETENNIMSVYFLDVGQGDSIFIEAPNGKQMLIDAGRNSSSILELSKYISFSDKEIDVVVATHPDSDHIGGLPEVFERFDILNFIDPSVTSDTNIYKELALRSGQEGSRYIKGERGLTIILDKKHGVYFQVLAPDESFKFTDTNNMSIIGKLVYGESSFLLTGDASKAVENILAYSDGELLESDILKAGHHGSKTSSSVLFLEKVKPDISIISASATNTYGHPHDDVIRALQSASSEIIQTKDEGSIGFETDGVTIWRK